MDGDVSDWSQVIDTNVKGVLNTIRPVLSGMKERGSGHVITLGSVAGRQVYPGGNVYCATKFAVDAYTTAARHDLVGTPIRVSAISFRADDFREDVEPVKPFPDVRNDPFGHPPTSLYGVSKRWMEIAGQFYANHLSEEQKILVVRLGGVGRNERPHRSGSRLWDSHGDLAGLLAAFIECDDDAPNFWVAFGVSDNHGREFSRPYFDTVTPCGFKPADNSFDAD